MAIVTSTGTFLETMVHAPSRVEYVAPAPMGFVFLVEPKQAAHLVGDRNQLEHIRAEISRLWAKDWDSPEDSVYDTW